MNVANLRDAHMLRSFLEADVLATTVADELERITGRRWADQDPDEPLGVRDEFYECWCECCVAQSGQMPCACPGEWLSYGMHEDACPLAPIIAAGCTRDWESDARKDADVLVSLARTAPVAASVFASFYASEHAAQHLAHLTRAQRREFLAMLPTRAHPALAAFAALYASLADLAESDDDRAGTSPLGTDTVLATLAVLVVLAFVARGVIRQRAERRSSPPGPSDASTLASSLLMAPGAPFALGAR